jgi:hypothetical protein
MNDINVTNDAPKTAPATTSLEWRTTESNISRQGKP